MKLYHGTDKNKSATPQPFGLGAADCVFKVAKR